MIIQCNGCHQWIETVSSAPHECPGESVAFAAGREARRQRIAITKSALRKMRPGSRQYDDYLEGYNYEDERRRRKPKAASLSRS